MTAFQIIILEDQLYNSIKRIEQKKDRKMETKGRKKERREKKGERRKEENKNRKKKERKLIHVQERKKK